MTNLGELAGRRQAIIDRQKETANPNHALLELIDIERDMLNAAQALMDIQPGDADRLERVVRFLLWANRAGMIVAGDIDCLRRYQAMASQMLEENQR